MTHHFFHHTAWVLAICATALAFDTATARDERTLNSDWMFIQNDVGLEATDVPWETVTIPHTWNALDGQNGGGVKTDPASGYYRGACWYQKKFTMDFDATSHRSFIKFDAASMVATVYLNGSELGQHKGAFTAFCYEITDFIKPGETNLLQVRVDNSFDLDIAPLSGDFTMFGGIYRPVHLLVTDQTCITPLDYASSGIYLSPKEVSTETAEIHVLSKINSASAAQIQVVTTVRDAEGCEVSTVSTAIDLAAKKDKSVSQALIIDAPHLWNGRLDPYLYSVSVQLIKNDQVIDAVTEALGVRTFHADPRAGFILNGKKYPLRGVNKHQDKKDKGWALSREDLKLDHDMIYEIGATGLRLAHYPHSSDFIELCDRSGIMVWSEIPLVNQITYSEAFSANAKDQLVEMIRQRYNHPSIFAWGLWNELMHLKSPDPVALIEHLDKVANAEDPYRPTVAAANYAVSRADGLAEATDWLAWNTYPGWYGSAPAEKLGPYAEYYNKKNQYKGVGISEYGAGASVKHHEQGMMKGPKTSGPWHPEEWQAILHEKSYEQIMNHDYLWGTFVWNMFDFSSINRKEGDAVGVNDKGLVTYDRAIRKDAFYFYKANWNPEPMVYITSRRHVDRKHPQTEVKIYSNAKEVELLVNGESQGKATPNTVNTFRWYDIQLNDGKNLIEAVTSIDGRVYKDQCEWNLLGGQE